MGQVRSFTRVHVDGQAVNGGRGDVPHVASKGRLVDPSVLRHRQHSGGKKSLEVDRLHGADPTVQRAGITFKCSQVPSGLAPDQGFGPSVAVWRPGSKRRQAETAPQLQAPPKEYTCRELGNLTGLRSLEPDCDSYSSPAVVATNSPALPSMTSSGWNIEG